MVVVVASVVVVALSVVVVVSTGTVVLTASVVVVVAGLLHEDATTRIPANRATSSGEMHFVTRLASRPMTSHPFESPSPYPHHSAGEGRVGTSVAIGRRNYDS